MNEFEAVMNKDTAVELSDYGLIKIEGDDAETFLHAQFTNDLQHGVDDSRSQLSAYCSPKGRILALFRIYKSNNIYYLSMPREIVEATHKRLSMFVLMSKVTLENVSDSIGQLGVAGPGIEEKLKALVGQPPEEMDGVAVSDAVTIIRIPGPYPRFLLLGATDEIGSLSTKLTTFATEVSPNAWELLDIRAAIPVIHQANVDAFVPQMVNLQAIDGLNFKKGCFPGQEIVARMQYLGKLKRRMYLVHSDCEDVATTGDAIYVHESEPRKVGTVVMAQPAPQGGSDLLIVAEIEATDTQALHQLENAESPLQLMELPYSLET